MRQRRRRVSVLVAIAAVVALGLSTVGTASAATQDVEYALQVGQVTLGANSYDLPAATGIAGTWDDVTGAFDGTWTSDVVSTTESTTSPVAGTIALTYQFLATTNVTGTIDPGTGMGTLSTTFDVVVTLESLTPDGTTTPVVLDQICTVGGVAVTFNASASNLVGGIYTDLGLVASGFSAPAATCVAGPAGNPALTPTVQAGFNDTAQLPTTETGASLRLQIGQVPPPSTTSTTTSTTAPSTTSTTAPAAASPAAAVASSPQFTG